MSSYIYKSKTGENSQYDGSEVIIYMTITKPEDMFKAIEDMDIQYRVTGENGLELLVDASELTPKEEDGPRFSYDEPRNLSKKAEKVLDGMVAVLENGEPILYCDEENAQALVAILNNSPYRSFNSVYPA